MGVSENGIKIVDKWEQVFQQCELFLAHPGEPSIKPIEWCVSIIEELSLAESKCAALDRQRIQLTALARNPDWVLAPDDETPAQRSAEGDAFVDEAGAIHINNAGEPVGEFWLMVVPNPMKEEIAIERSNTRRWKDSSDANRDEAMKQQDRALKAERDAQAMKAERDEFAGDFVQACKDITEARLERDAALERVRVLREALEHISTIAKGETPHALPREWILHITDAALNSTAPVQQDAQPGGTHE